MALETRDFYPHRFHILVCFVICNMLTGHFTYLMGAVQIEIMGA